MAPYYPAIPGLIQPGPAGIVSRPGNTPGKHVQRDGDNGSETR